MPLKRDGNLIPRLRKRESLTMTHRLIAIWKKKHCSATSLAVGGKIATATGYWSMGNAQLPQPRCEVVCRWAALVKVMMALAVAAMRPCQVVLFPGIQFIDILHLLSSHILSPRIAGGSNRCC